MGKGGGEATRSQLPEAVLSSWYLHPGVKDTYYDIFGYTWEEIQAMQHGTFSGRTIRREPGTDYGSDPLGDGVFKMVPSGDVVDLAERNRRLNKDNG